MYAVHIHFYQIEYVNPLQQGRSGHCQSGYMVALRNCGMFSGKKQHVNIKSTDDMLHHSMKVA